MFCFNRRVDRSLAEKLNAMFVELVFAPGYDDDALEILEQKPNVRLLDNRERRRVPVTEQDVKRVRGGLLVQDRDTGLELREEMQVMTRAQAERGGVGRAAVRDAGVQARALERDRAGQRRRAPWASAPAR